MAKVKPIRKQRPSSLPLPVAKLCPINMKQSEPVRIVLGTGIFYTGSLGISRWCHFSLVDFKMSHEREAIGASKNCSGKWHLFNRVFGNLQMVSIFSGRFQKLIDFV